MAADQIDELLGIYQRLGLFNGSVLVADQGEVVIKKGYGLANMEWDIPNSPDTKFRLGSNTKQFTATLILPLVEQGHIELDAPVTRVAALDVPSPFAASLEDAMLPTEEKIYTAAKNVLEY